jgi:hypothetical protein
MVGKGTCPYSAPIVIAGLKSVTQTNAFSAEMNGAKGHERVYGVIAMENGDKVYVQAQDTTLLRKGEKQSTPRVRSPSQVGLASSKG